MQQIESVVEQRDRQRDPLRRSQGLAPSSARACWLPDDHPPMRRRMTGGGLHDRPPRNKHLERQKSDGVYVLRSQVTLRHYPMAGCMHPVVVPDRGGRRLIRDALTG
jgi:hypothetical protein